AEDGIRDRNVTGVQTCALPISFHNGLVVLHYDEPARTEVLEPGMTLTVEPMISLGGAGFDVWDDDWTVTTADKAWTAQFEHTVLVTEDGHEVLTLPTEG